VGLGAATGEVIAYTDSDCVVNPDWLTLLVHQLVTTRAAAVGGPNLSPEDGRVAACVAASPGLPTHVLESDQVAEHVPGCNMAFRRDALAAINGFDPVYRKAGDDVDVCWRLQQAGMWITYAPGAFVWHHRRQTPKAYLKQQAGYGEAEALLRFKHPDKFNGRGDGRWRGVLYGGALRGLRLGVAVIYRGTFGTGLFQCVYQPGPVHWAMLPTTLEWHAVAVLAALAGLAWPAGLPAAAAMLALSLALAGLQAVQAHLSPAHDGFRSRWLVAALCYLQPLVRSWSRYRTRLFAYRPPAPAPEVDGYTPGPAPLGGVRCVEYWSERGVGRTDLLRLAVAYLDEHRWGKVIDSGWSDWDLEVYCDRLTVVRVSSAQEEHGGGKRLIRVRFRVLPGRHVKLAAAAAAMTAAVAVAFGAGPAAVTGAALLGTCAALWRRGTRRAAALIGLVDGLAGQLKITRCGVPKPRQDSDAAEQPAPAVGGIVVAGEA
jgi:hypothetical protein